METDLENDDGIELDEDALRCMTLTQPWAGLVASGIKLVENRPRPIVSRAGFGKVFAIHASREIHEDVYERIFELAPELPGRTPAEWGCRWHRLSRVTSAVIAIARLRDAMYIGGCNADGIAQAVARAGLAEDQVRWTFGPTAYVLGEVTVLPEPVPCRGFQGFFRLRPLVERRVLQQALAAGAPAVIADQLAARLAALEVTLAAHAARREAAR